MGKQAIRNCQLRMVQSWEMNPVISGRISSHIQEFHQLRAQQMKISRLISDYEVIYLQGEITKSEYRKLKSQIEKDYGETLRYLKNQQRKLFEQMYFRVLVAGNQNQCYLCGCALDISDDYTRDHVFPDSMGFSISWNMMPVHRVCNVKKGNRMPTGRELSRVIAAYEFAGFDFAPRRKCTRKEFGFDYREMLVAE